MNGWHKIRVFGVAVGIALWAWTAAAQDVVLTSRDGAITLEGTLLSYDGEFFRIDSTYGALTLDAQGVTCAGPGCPDLGAFVADIRLSGAATMGAVLMPALVENFGATRGLRLRRAVTDDAHFRYELSDATDDRLVARFHFRVSTTDEGFADLLAEEADLAMALREARPDEVQRGKDAGLGDLSAPRRARVVALDGLVPIVARGDGRRQIAVTEMVGLLTGTIEAPVYLRNETSGVAQGMAQLLLPTDAVVQATRLTDNAAVADAVARRPGSFGVSVFSETGVAEPLDVAGVCGRPIAASVVSLKTEDYPLATPLLLYTPGRRLLLIGREFLQYIGTPMAQAVIRRAGFVDQLPDRIPLAAQGRRLQNAVAAAGEETSLADLQDMLAVLDGADRLTTTFRFRDGATRMDAQSEGNIERLARDIEAGLHDGQEIVLVGFSDGQGPAATNKRLSLRRAEATRAALREEAALADFSRLKLSATGFGEAQPIGCDEDAWGRKVNRRVEVWIRDGVPN
jgi:phosphate transport system substrate-binding protein